MEVYSKELCCSNVEFCNEKVGQSNKNSRYLKTTFNDCSIQNSILYKTSDSCQIWHAKCVYRVLGYFPFQTKKSQTVLKTSDIRKHIFSQVIKIIEVSQNTFHYFDAK